MNINHYYDVVSLVASLAEKGFPAGKHVSKKQMYELEFCCRALENYFDRFGVNEFSAEYNEKTEEILVFINSDYLKIDMEGTSILSVIEKAKGLSFDCGEDGSLRVCFRFGIM